MQGYSLEFVERINTSPHSDVKRLAMRAIQLRVSVIEIAAYLGVTRIAVYSWFSGKRRPSATHFQQLEKYLG